MKTYTYAYKGEPKSGFYWQILFLTDSGIFSTVGDVGEWGYSSFYTDDIRRFVLSLDPNDDYYLPTKLAKGRKTEFNGRQTLKDCKDHILEHRRMYNGISEEEAREAWDSLPESYDSQREWEDYLSNREEVYGPEWWYMLSMDWDSMLKSFCKNSLPGLQALIKAELEEEEAQALLKGQLVV
jgi:hypothetical protein